MSNVYIVKNSADVQESKLAAGEVKLPIAKLDGNKGKSGLCIVLPQISDSVLTLVFNSEEGQEFFVANLNKVRSGIASVLHKKGMPITSDKIGITGILEALKQHNALTVKFNKESIAVWFNTELMQYFLPAVTAKFSNVSQDKIEAIVARYREDFMILASNDAVLSKELIAKLEKAMMLLPDDYEHAISERLAERLTSAKNRDIGDCL